VQRPGEQKLKHLFRPGTLGRFETKNQIKYGACCVSNYNTRDGFITPRELARVRGDRRHRLRHHHEPGRLSRPSG